jgi:hypothetical protein
MKPILFLFIILYAACSSEDEKVGLRNGASSDAKSEIEKKTADPNWTSLPTTSKGGLPKDMFTKAGSAANEFGDFRSADLTGRIDGFAYDKSNPALTVPVEIYTAPYTQGLTPLITSKADKAGSSGVTGNHRFDLNIAPNLPKSGKVTIYIYAVIGGTRKAIGDSPKTFGVYKQSVNGRAFFDNSAASIFSGACNQCHAPRGYEAMWLNLLNPTPDAGGTRTNNVLYRKASGGGHANVCSSNSKVCDTISNWFDKEISAP